MSLLLPHWTGPIQETWSLFLTSVGFPIFRKHLHRVHSNKRLERGRVKTTCSSLRAQRSNPSNVDLTGLFRRLRLLAMRILLLSFSLQRDGLSQSSAKIETRSE